MSADNAIFVQKRKDGKFSAQNWGMSGDDLPDPEKAPENHVYDDLLELIASEKRAANEAEYGFEFVGF